MFGKIRHVTIIGVGLLGGSAGLAIKARDPSVRIAGVGRRRKSLRQALDMGAIDSAHLDAAEAVGASDLIILATPVGAFESYLRAIRPHLAKGAVVVDVGSTKATVVRLARRVLSGGRSGVPFVGSHPMAGSEHKGAAYARADLFEGATCILTPTTGTPPKLLRQVEAFWRALGARTVRMSPAVHDRTVAMISHLPHALAAILMTLPTDGELSVAASGFRDATRLASGDVEMWRDIFLTTRAEALRALGSFKKVLGRFQSLLRRGDPREIERFLQAAKDRRDRTLLSAPHESPRGPE